MADVLSQANLELAQEARRTRARRVVRLTDAHIVRLALDHLRADRGTWAELREAALADLDRHPLGRNPLERQR